MSSNKQKTSTLEGSDTSGRGREFFEDGDYGDGRSQTRETGGRRGKATSSGQGRVSLSAERDTQTNSRRSQSSRRSHSGRRTPTVREEVERLEKKGRASDEKSPRRSGSIGAHHNSRKGSTPRSSSRSLQSSRTPNNNRQGSVSSWYSCQYPAGSKSRETSEELDDTILDSVSESGDNVIEEKSRIKSQSLTEAVFGYNTSGEGSWLRRKKGMEEDHTVRMVTLVEQAGEAAALPEDPFESQTKEPWSGNQRQKEDGQCYKQLINKLTTKGSQPVNKFITKAGEQEIQVQKISADLGKNTQQPTEREQRLQLAQDQQYPSGPHSQTWESEAVA